MAAAAMVVVATVRGGSSEVQRSLRQPPQDLTNVGAARAPSHRLCILSGTCVTTVPGTVFRTPDTACQNLQLCKH